MKCFLQKLFIGMGMGSVIFNLVMLAFLATASQEVMQVIFAQYPVNFLASLVIGIVFSVMSLIYRSKRLGMPLKVVIHMGTGLLVYFGLALALGWISLQPIICAVSIMIALVTSGCIWLGFYLYNRAQCRQLNAALGEKRG